MTRCVTIPLSGWADRQLRELAVATGASKISKLTGAGLLGERANLNRFRVPGQVSAGGGCRLLRAFDGWLALSLTRPDDRDLLPALFCDAAFDPHDDDAIAAQVATARTPELVARGAELGLAIAASPDTSIGPAWEVTTTDHCAPIPRNRSPLVIDLSALWAGPLATHLFQLAGATVLKIESRNRPDAMRHGDAALFGLLNQNKASIALDLTDSGERAHLLALIRKADIVVEASRPRALLQFGIDADALIAEVPGLVWTTITGHGVSGDAAQRIGFGDDCGVAGGLTAALFNASGTTGFVGDAIADPLTGIMAAQLAWTQWTSGAGGRIVMSMSGVVAQALADERTHDLLALQNNLRAWATAQGESFPPCPERSAATVRPFGVDTQRWLAEALPC